VKVLDFGLAKEIESTIERKRGGGGLTFSLNALKASSHTALLMGWATG
jgi:hypothetical protein